jgi:hypothetical protein
MEPGPNMCTTVLYYMFAQQWLGRLLYSVKVGECFELTHCLHLQCRPLHKTRNQHAASRELEKDGATYTTVQQLIPFYFKDSHQSHKKVWTYPHCTCRKLACTWDCTYQRRDNR